MGRFFGISEEHRSINEGITKWQREIGQVILWYEFDRGASVLDPVYDESGARRWLVPKRIPVYSTIRVEAAEEPSAEGFYTVDRIHFSALLEQLRRHSLSNPYDAQAHLHDRVVWDGFVWELRRYQIVGRIENFETTVSIDAVKVSPEEMVNDIDFQAFDQPV